MALTPLLTNPERLASLLATLPKTPGVYQMRSSKGVVIYVGKANSLQARVRQYFQVGARSDRLPEEICDIEVIPCTSEREALALECTLIKRYRPRYNVLLKDDHNYLYVHIPTPTSTLPLDPAAFPKLLITRRSSHAHARAFGPFPDAKALRSVLRALENILPLRRCLDSQIRNQEPCFYHHLGRCAGPCAGAITPAQYIERLQQIEQVFTGHQQTLVRYLHTQMLAAAESLDYETAGSYRDRLAALARFSEQQSVVLAHTRAEEDYLGLARHRHLAQVALLSVRKGVVIGVEEHALDISPESTDTELLSAFISQFYSQSTTIPRRLLLSQTLPDQELLVDFLTEKRGAPVELVVAQRGSRKRLLQQANHAAQVTLDSRLAAINADSQSAIRLLADLQERLGLAALPRRIECYDISNTMGQNSVGSLVVMENGKPAPSQYRIFKIKTVVGPDDFASMQEVLGRRFGQFHHSLQDPNDPLPVANSFANLPDLIIIDGGKGQLSAARKAIEAAGLGAVPTFGLAKREEELFYPGSDIPIILPRESQSLFLVQRIRDEAHRFAITHHRGLRAKAMVRSRLDEVTGIGPAKKRALLRRFGDLVGIRNASLDELETVPGITRAIALRLHELL